MGLDRAEILKTLLNIPAARSKLAEAMAAPLRRRIDYTGIARKVFLSLSLCKVCGKKTKKYRVFTLDFETVPRFTIPRTGLYKVCPKCMKKTGAKLSTINELPLLEMPLYVNDSNIFVEKRAIERLRKGE
jgi:hypothetical protein